MLLFVLLGSSAVAWAQDVIVKKDGSTVVCRVVEITETEVVYKKWNDLQGANYVLERSSVSSVSYQDGKRVDLSTAKNLYKPNNQNDGTQQYNDNALLAIDRAEHSKKKVKHPRKKVEFPFKWVVKAGLSLDHVTGLEGLDLNAKLGYELNYGLLYPFKKSNFAIGLDVYFSSFSVGGLSKYNDFSKLNVGGTPNLGYRFPIGKKMILFPYVGFYAGSMSGEGGRFLYHDDGRVQSVGYLRAVSGMAYGFDIGLNFFLTEKFFINAHYKKGLDKYEETWTEWVGLDRYGYNDFNYRRNSTHAGKFVIGVGIMF